MAETKIEALARLVAEMRRVQQGYMRAGDLGWLPECRKKEAAVDEAVREILGPTLEAATR